MNTSVQHLGKEAAQILFESLNDWSDLEQLVDDATPEGVYLECKSQAGIQLSGGTKNQLAETISAFSNASGGVLLLGVSTTVVKGHNLDVVSGLEPIGHVSKLAAKLEIALPMLTEPPVVGTHIKVLGKPKTKSGVVAILVPASHGDPLRSASSGHFYFRGNDGDIKAPYEVIRRLFAASDVPDLVVSIDQDLSTKNDDGTFSVHFSLANRSSATAREVELSILIDNFESCISLTSPHFVDESNLNPGRKLFGTRPDGVIHRGLNVAIGQLDVRMAGSKWPRRALHLRASVFADRMRARYFEFRISLLKSGLKIRSSSGPHYVY